MVAAVIGALLWFLRRKRREQPQRGIKPHDISGPVQRSAQGTTLFQGDYLGESCDPGRGLSRLQLDLKPVVFEADRTPEMIPGEMWGKAWPRGARVVLVRVDCGLRPGSGGEGRLSWGRLNMWDVWEGVMRVLGCFGVFDVEYGFVQVLKVMSCCLLVGHGLAGVWWPGMVILLGQHEVLW